VATRAIIKREPIAAISTCHPQQIRSTRLCEHWRVGGAPGHVRHSKLDSMWVQGNQTGRL